MFTSVDKLSPGNGVNEVTYSAALRKDRVNRPPVIRCASGVAQPKSTIIPNKPNEYSKTFATSKHKKDIVGSWVTKHNLQTVDRKEFLFVYTRISAQIKCDDVKASRDDDKVHSAVVEQLK